MVMMALVATNSVLDYTMGYEPQLCLTYARAVSPLKYRSMFDPVMNGTLDSHIMI